MADCPDSHSTPRGAERTTAPAAPISAAPIPAPSGSLDQLVRDELRDLQIVDVHTHLFDPAMNAASGGAPLLLSGVDELLTYHYHLAELFRARPDLDPEEFAARPLADQADLIWRELFVLRTPLSEVGRGVCELLHRLGLDPNAADLREARGWFADHDLAARVETSLRLAGVREVCMTNDPLDGGERRAWDAGFERDPRFVAALRLDSAIMDWPAAVPALRALGHDVTSSLDDGTATALRRYLVEWHRRMAARYMAVSLPPDWGAPEQTPWLHLLRSAVLPAARELDTPVALMVGVRRAVNPRLRLAGDGLGSVDVRPIERLIADFPDVRFRVTTLDRGSQHALCVAARKFANLMPFGCWWFVNNPSLVAEITRMRLDLLGPSFVAQHSDARVLEQMVFKWQRSRDWLLQPLIERYADLERAGYAVSAEVVRRDLRTLLGRSL